MSKRKHADEAPANGAETAGSPDASAYIRRLIDDNELRETVGRALESSRRAYERLSKTRKTSKLLDDKKLQADVHEALEAFRDAALGLTDAPRRGAKKARKRGRKLMVLALGGGLAMVASEDLRSKVLDALFGAEEEFEYTPPAGAEAQPPDPAA
jgi:hypothetical protein